MSPPATGDVPSEPDEALVRRLRRSFDAVAFEQLVERHRGRTFRLIAAVLGPGMDAEAEEVTQEVFLQVFQRLDSFRFESRFSTWLYRMAWRRAIDRKRLARHRLPHVAIDTLADRAAGGGAPAEEETMLRQIDGPRVRACAERLKEPYRTTVYLHYWLNQPVDEIALAMQTRPGTVKARLFRARRQLSRALLRGAGRSPENDS